MRSCISSRSNSAVCGAPHTAEFERALIHERQREGIALAKQRGAYKGRKKALSATAVTELRARIALGISKAKVARELASVGKPSISIYKTVRWPHSHNTHSIWHALRSHCSRATPQPSAGSAARARRVKQPYGGTSSKVLARGP
jgi:hypothetical protein